MDNKLKDPRFRKSTSSMVFSLVMNYIESQTTLPSVRLFSNQYLEDGNNMNLEEVFQSYAEANAEKNNPSDIVTEESDDAKTDINSQHKPYHEQEKADKIAFGLVMKYVKPHLSASSVNNVIDEPIISISDDMSLEDVFKIYSEKVDKEGNTATKNAAEAGGENLIIGNINSVSHRQNIPVIELADKPTQKKNAHRNHKLEPPQLESGSTLSALNELVPITELYGNVMKDSESPMKKDIDILISTIFKENILVQKLNAFTSQNDVKRLSKEAEFLKHGRFTEEEDDIIVKNWETLLSKCNIEVNDKIFKTIFGTKKGISEKLTSPSIDDKRKKGIVGCFLGQHLKVTRHCMDVLERASHVLQPSKGGKYTKQDDALILQGVEKSGDNPSTWKELSLKLSRDPSRWCNVRNRYLYSMRRQRQASGKWSLLEDQILIEKLFKGKECSLETVKKSQTVYSEGIPEITRRSNTIYNHWRGVIKPILMSYHLGTLHSNWKRNFLTYIVDKGVKYRKEIDWVEVSKLFPAQNISSLTNILASYENSKEMPLCKEVQESIYKRKNENDYSENRKLYRENIVKLYVETCNR